GLVTAQHRLPDDRLSGTGQGLVRTELRVGDAGGGQGSHRLDVRDYFLSLVLVDICERRQVFWPEDWFHHDRPLSSLTVGLAATGPRLGPGRRLLLDGELPLGTEATDNRLVGGDRRPRPLIDRLDRHTSALRRLRVLVPRRLRLLVVGREPGRVDRPAGRELDEVRDHVVLEQVPL